MEPITDCCTLCGRKLSAHTSCPKAPRKRTKRPCGTLFELIPVYDFVEDVFGDYEYEKFIRWMESSDGRTITQDLEENGTKGVNIFDRVLPEYKPLHELSQDVDPYTLLYPLQTAIEYHYSWDEVRSILFLFSEFRLPLFRRVLTVFFSCVGCSTAVRSQPGSNWLYRSSYRDVSFSNGLCC